MRSTGVEPAQACGSIETLAVVDFKTVSSDDPAEQSSCELLKRYELGVKTRTIEERTVVTEFFEQF